jgi:hypothetical protein
VKIENKKCNVLERVPACATWPPPWLAPLTPRPAPSPSPALAEPEPHDSPGDVSRWDQANSLRPCYWCGGRRFWQQSLRWPDVIRYAACCPPAHSEQVRFLEVSEVLTSTAQQRAVSLAGCPAGNPVDKVQAGQDS